MNRIINSYLILLLINSTNSEQSLQCGDWSTYKDEKCFKILESIELQKFEDAINTCHQNEGSSLVTIHSQGEQEFLFNLLTNIHKQLNNVWIGAQINDKLIKWSDNTTVNYTNWANDNPRNTSGYDCVQMSLTEPYNGKWLNEPCSQNNLVVCQKTQNWLFSYLQQTVMELRKSLDETKDDLQRSKETIQGTNDELMNTKTELKNVKEDLQKTRSEFQDTKHFLENEIMKSIPPGTIVYFTNTTAPQGWLKANGEQVSRTTYANLYASIGTTFGSGDGSTTFTLPDLRGEFIRGWSDGRDVDNERSFASFQWGSSIPYVTFINNNAHVSSSTGFYQHRAFAGKTFDGGFQAVMTFNETRNGITFDGYYNEIVTFYSDLTSVGNITGWTMLSGTRPRNIALLACIKY